MENKAIMAFSVLYTLIGKTVFYKFQTSHLIKYILGTRIDTGWKVQETQAKDSFHGNGKEGKALAAKNSGHLSPLNK